MDLGRNSDLAANTANAARGVSDGARNRIDLHAHYIPDFYREALIDAGPGAPDGIRELIVDARASHSGTAFMSPPALSKVGVTDSDWTDLRARLLRGLLT
jgi:hypothetical protein